MDKEYKILIIGDISSIYIINFIKYLKKENPSVHIYFWGAKPQNTNNYSQIFNYLDDYSLYDIRRRFNKIPLLRNVEFFFRWRNHFKKFTQSNHFDIVNIHYVYSKYFFLFDSIKNVAKNVVLSPWGSDVYRINKFEKCSLYLLYKKADYISGVNNRFTNDVLRVFNLNKEKIITFDLGSEAIDYILANKDTINNGEAKRKLGIANMFAITCGYNASPAQQHVLMIDAIYKIKNQLPSDLILLFPFTYGSNEEYKKMIKKHVLDLNLKALYVEEFLEIPDLFILRQATDMFIHIQTTDANSTSVGEYLLCGKKVVNGAWLKYDELEKSGTVPYFAVKDLTTLDQEILAAYKSEMPQFDKSILETLEEKSCAVNAKKANTSFMNILS